MILKNLPYNNVIEKNIERFFKKKCGPIRFVNVLRTNEGTCKGVAFIRFEKREGSDKGLTLNGFFYEGRKVSIEYAKTK